MLKPRFRDAVVLCGLIGAVFVAFTQAQPPDDVAKTARERLIERLVTLRTEVELLQIEHDVDRDDLVKSMSDLRKLRREGLDPETLQAAAQSASQFEMARAAGLIGEKEFNEMLNSKGSAAELKEVGIAITAEELKSLKGGALARFIAQVEIKVKDKKLRESIKEKKTAFTRQTLELNRKKLELDEAEARYKTAH